jgi:hypothetical protein
MYEPGYRLNPAQLQFHLAELPADHAEGSRWKSTSTANLKSALHSVSYEVDWKDRALQALSVVELGGIVATLGQLVSPKVGRSVSLLRYEVLSCVASALLKERSKYCHWARP